jgi:hypothetical protein
LCRLNTRRVVDAYGAPFVDAAGVIAPVRIIEHEAVRPD